MSSLSGSDCLRALWYATRAQDRDNSEEPADRAVKIKTTTKWCKSTFGKIAERIRPYHTKKTQVTPCVSSNNFQLLLMLLLMLFAFVLMLTVTSTFTVTTTADGSNTGLLYVTGIGSWKRHKGFVSFESFCCVRACVVRVLEQGALFALKRN